MNQDKAAAAPPQRADEKHVRSLTWDGVIPLQARSAERGFRFEWTEVRKMTGREWDAELDEVLDQE